MTRKIVQGIVREIVFDCESPLALVRFWEPLLDGYALRDDFEPGKDAEFLILAGPGPMICFQRYPGQTYGNGRAHLDIAVPDRPDAVARMREHGAAFVREEDTYTVLADPEGNRFCVVEVRR